MKHKVINIQSEQSLFQVRFLKLLIQIAYTSNQIYTYIYILFIFIYMTALYLFFFIVRNLQPITKADIVLFVQYFLYFASIFNQKQGFLYIFLRLLFILCKLDRFYLFFFFYFKIKNLGFWFDCSSDFSKRNSTLGAMRSFFEN